MMCEDKGYSVFVSSGSNDVLDGYAEQDCIILDDLRPSCMGLSDLLKMLDNNTASTVKSRYKNKVLECKLIIVTSVLKIDEFFNGVFKEQKEPIVQLKDVNYICVLNKNIIMQASLMTKKAITLKNLNISIQLQQCSQRKNLQKKKNLITSTLY